MQLLSLIETPICGRMKERAQLTGPRQGCQNGDSSPSSAFILLPGDTRNV